MIMRYFHTGAHQHTSAGAAMSALRPIALRAFPYESPASGCALESGCL
jgi:hypothetical protein